MKRTLKLFCALLPVLLFLCVIFSFSASADSPLRITKNLPTQYSVKANESVTLSVEASGGSGSYFYQWYGSHGSLNWTGSSLTFTLASEDTIWCVISNGDQSVVSNACVLNVVSDPTPQSSLNPAAPVTAPKITRQPVSVAMPLGQGGGIFSVAATNEWLGAGVELKYQWYSCPIDNMRYAAPIDGATSPSYTVPVGYQEGKVFYVVEIRTSNGQKTSDPVYSNVVYAKYGASSVLEVTKSPTSESVEEGGKATFIAHADGATRHQWRFLPQGYPSEKFFTAQNLGMGFPGVEVIGADTDILVLAKIPAALNGTRIFCVYYDALGNFVITNSATLSVKAKPAAAYPPEPSHVGTVRPDRDSHSAQSQLPADPPIAAPTITVQPEGVTLEWDESTTLRVGAVGRRSGSAKIRYQWYKTDKNSNANGTAIAGAQSADYTPEPIYGTKYYYVGVWTSDGTRNSKVVYSVPAAVTYTAASSLPTTPSSGGSEGQKDLISRLALPVIAMLSAGLLFSVAN